MVTPLKLLNNQYLSFDYIFIPILKSFTVEYGVHKKMGCGIGLF